MTTEPELIDKLADLLWDEHHREYHFDRTNAVREAIKLFDLVKETLPELPKDQDDENGS